MKKFFTMFLLALMTQASVAYAYEGGWDTSMYDEYGRELLLLGDNTDNSYRALSGTRSYCARPGLGYASMRRIVNREYHQITWWVEADCGSVIRVCVENSYGQWGCSSYLDRGWIYR